MTSEQKEKEQEKEREKYGIKHLNMSYTSCSDETLKELGENHIHTLTSINLTDCRKITDLGMRSLAECVNLSHLNLSNVPITDVGVGYLCARLSNLQEFHLSCSGVTDMSMEHLKTLQNLMVLDMFEAVITDNGVQYFCQAVSSRNQNLTTIEFAGGRLSNLALQHIATIPALTSVNVAQNALIDDGGVEHLRVMTHLRHLNLSGTATTERGVGHLASIASLRTLSLFGCVRVNPRSRRLTAISKNVRVGMDHNREHKDLNSL